MLLPYFIQYCPNIPILPDKIIWRLTTDTENGIMPTNSHTERGLKAESATWQPVRPPKRGQSRTAFHAYMLLPGFSLAFHAAVLGRSLTSIATYRAAAIKAARSDPAITAAVHAAIVKLSHLDGLQMARLRGKAQLPSWSRLAIGEYRKRGLSRREIAVAFRCSPGTVANVLQGKGKTYGLFSGERRLTHAQQYPSGRWKNKRRLIDKSDSLNQLNIPDF